MPAKSNKTTGRRFLSSVWAFPLILLSLLIILTAFKVSGSSVGMFHKFLYGPSSQDSSLIYGKPRAIRADEWQGAASLIVAQSKIGFPTHDLTLGGQDVSMSAGIPSKTWPMIFRPHLWSYLVLPVEFAFALSWWLIMYLLIVSCYFFVLRIMQGDKRLAILISLAFGLSPFLMWWYEAASFMTVAYGFMMMILAIRILDNEPIGRIKDRRANSLLYIAALAFVVAAFGLILYPPFQIPVALTVLAFAIGYILQKKYGENTAWQTLAKRSSLALISLVIAAFVGIAFIHYHQATIKTLNATVYPGHRTVTSGGFGRTGVLDGFVMPLLQSDLRGGHFIGNQSEASNFILLLPFLILPAVLLMWRRWRRSRGVDWVYLAINLCGLVFLAHLFIPHGNLIYKLLLLNRVPHQRLMIGLGFLGIIQLVLTIRFIKEEKLAQDKLWKWSGAYSAVCLAILLATGLRIRANYPIFLHSYALIVALAAAFTVIIFFTLANKRILAAICLLVFTLASSFQIIPLYRGLGELTDSRVLSAMQSVSGPHDSWVVVGDDAYNYGEYGILAVRPTLSGMQTYPTLDLWRQTGDPNYNYVTNRESHVVFSDNPELKSPLTLVHNNSFEVKFDCSPFIKQHVRYALSVHPLKDSCVKQVGPTISYPKVTFYMYKVD